MRILNFVVRLKVVWILAALVLSGPGASADEKSLSAEPETMPVERFFKEMQLLARRVPVGNTKLEKEDSLAKLREEIHAEFDGVILEYKVRITSVDWRNGFATIKTESPIRKYKPSARMPFTFTMMQPLKVALSREEAANLNRRKPLRFLGTLKFLGGKSVIHGQQPKLFSAFWIRHELYKPFNTVGAFVSESYSVFIGDDEVFAVVAEPEAE